MHKRVLGNLLTNWKVFHLVPNPSTKLNLPYFHITLYKVLTRNDSNDLSYYVYYNVNGKILTRTIITLKSSHLSTQSCHGRSLTFWLFPYDQSTWSLHRLPCFKEAHLTEALVCMNNLFYGQRNMITYVGVVSINKTKNRIVVLVVLVLFLML